MRKIICCRGCQGSGKSTLAAKSQKELASHDTYIAVIETDMFWFDNGEYKWQGSRMGDGHKWCQLETERMLRLHPDAVVIVANTFILAKELLAYANIALMVGATMEVREPESPQWKAKSAQLLFDACLHGVPLATIERNLKRWEVLDKTSFATEAELREFIKVYGE